MLSRSMGMVNTVYAVLFGLIFPITGVWAFVAIANSQGVSEKVEYAAAISKPAIALVMVQMVYCLNNFLPSLIYISDTRLRSPILAYREVALIGNEIARQLPQYDAIVFWYGIILSIIPVGILAVLRTYFKRLHYCQYLECHIEDKMHGASYLLFSTTTFIFLSTTTWARVISSHFPLRGSNPNRILFPAFYRAFGI